MDAYRHAMRVLVVSALINETVDTARARQYRGGVLTRWNTFQKFFDQQEVEQYIEDALETTAVPVGLGVFYIFRDPAEQQDFLSARSRRAIDWAQISARLGLGGPSLGSRSVRRSLNLAKMTFATLPLDSSNSHASNPPVSSGNSFSTRACGGGIGGCIRTVTPSGCQTGGPIFPVMAFPAGAAVAPSVS